jgi:hypothetical protein
LIIPKKKQNLIYFIEFFLAITIPSIVDNGHCTKDNCTNDTFTGHSSPVTPTSSILPEEAVQEEVERSCDTLFMCIVTTLNKGLRNGGGIGDVLRQPSNQVCIENKYWFFFSNVLLFLFKGTTLLLPCYL